MYYQVHHILVHYIAQYDRVFLSDMIIICSITGVKERLSPGVDYSAIDYH